MIIFLRHDCRKRNFTLIEMLVVLGVIGILAGLLLPVLQTARIQARRSGCLNNLKQIGLTMIYYSHNYENYPRVGIAADDFPDEIDLDSAQALSSFGINIAGPDELIWKCPSTFYSPIGVDGSKVKLYGAGGSDANYALMTNWIGVASYDNTTPSGLSPSTVDPKIIGPLVGDSINDWTGPGNSGSPGSMISGPHSNNDYKALGGNQIFSDGHGKWFTYSELTDNGPRWSGNSKKFYWSEMD